MDFSLADGLAQHRQAARQWAATNVDPHWVSEQRRTGCWQTLGLHRRLADDGILGAGWNPRYGGSDVHPDYARAIFEELFALGLHAEAWATTAMVARTIEQLGTEAQRLEYIGAVLRGEVLIALGFSEADSGSDVAAAKTSAAADGSEWVINGQKMFTSTAQVCSHVFVLARTNSEAPKHKGLSLFLVPTDSVGYELQPMHTIGGQVTNVTFYSDVRVPDSARIGDVNDGWNVMNVALVFERGVGTPNAFEEPIASELVEWARSTQRADGTSALDEPAVRETIGRIAIDEEVSRLLAGWADWRAEQGILSTVDGGMRKLFSTEALLRNTGAAVDVIGSDAIIDSEHDAAAGQGAFDRAFRQAIVKTVYAGTSEILRDLIAQRHLGLPRNRPKA